MRTRKNLPPKHDSPDNRNLAFNFALKYLSYRARSIKEVYDYLLKKNFIEDTVNSALKRLIDLKFLNDEEFTRQWIESRQKYKGKSKFVLKQELRIKGIASDMIDHTLKEAQDDFETARILFNKKKKTLEKLPPQEFKKKISGFLSRKGYSFGIINKLLRD